MTLAVLVIVSASTVLLLLLYGATVELYRQVLQLRVHAGLTDETQPLGFNREAHLSDLAIPATRAAGAARYRRDAPAVGDGGPDRDAPALGDGGPDRDAPAVGDGGPDRDALAVGDGGPDRDPAAVGDDRDGHAGAAAGRRDSGRQAVLILSDSCTTCADVARGLRAEPPPGLVALVESRSAAAARAWLAAQGLAAGERVIYDEAGRMADRLGVAVTPAVVRFEGGRATAAATVPSRRQLEAVIAWLGDAEARASAKAR